MSKKDLLDEQAYSLIMQDHQLSSAQAKLGQVDNVTNQLNIDLAQMLNETDQIIAESQNLLENLDQDFLEIVLDADDEVFFIVDDDPEPISTLNETTLSTQKYSTLSLLDTLNFQTILHGMNIKNHLEHSKNSQISLSRKTLLKI
jgi:uncharacterized protein YoxC